VHLRVPRLQEGKTVSGQTDQGRLGVLKSTYEDPATYVKPESAFSEGATLEFGADHLRLW
jgi:hypothetical protein